jgi:hypothetical protein
MDMTANFWEGYQPEPTKPAPVQQPSLNQGADYERGFIDGMQHQAQSSVDKAVNTMAQRQWVGLKPGEAEAFYNQFAKYQQEGPVLSGWFQFTKAIEAKLKELNT